MASDKPIWLTNVMNRLDGSPNQVADVGESTGDWAMVTAVAHAFYTAHSMLAGLVVQHQPAGNMFTIAQETVSLT